MNYCYLKPSSLMRELQQELLGLSTQPSMMPDNAWAPHVDIKEETNEFVVFADIPGVDPKDIQIDMEGNTLTVKGEKKSFKEEKDKNYYRQERVSGKFFRQFTLPETIDADKISAKAKQGVLAIHLPKAKQENLQRKITVQEVE
ncbi:MAG: Hsp20/alpha crystallin family protein [Candidatus Berkiella sp.]